MLEVYICVGSSCHIKGSYYIIKNFEELIQRYKLEDEIELKASFCLGHCTNGVSVCIDGEIIGGFTPENTEELFNKHVLGRLGK